MAVNTITIILIEGGDCVMKSKIHRCNCRKVWTIQNRKKKMTAATIFLNGSWSTELKPDRNCNPRGFVITNRSENIFINPSVVFLRQFVKVAKLIYDKRNIDFNVKQGKFLYFAEDGTCFLLKRIEDYSEE